MAGGLMPDPAQNGNPMPGHLQVSPSPVLPPAQPLWGGQDDGFPGPALVPPAQELVEPEDDVARK